MNAHVEKYYLFLINVIGNIALEQYYSKCQQPEDVSFIKEPILTNNCATEMYGSIMCNRIHSCDMFKKNGNTCIFYSSNAGCHQMGTHNKRLFKRLSCPAVWSLKSNICYARTISVKCINIQNSCKDVGGIAAEFYSTEEMDTAPISDDMYVGGSKQNGVFLWDVSQQQIDSTLWLPNEPDIVGDCVQIMQDNHRLDALESRFKRPVLCEKRLFRWV